MGKPNLGEAAAEPHSVLLDEVRFYRDIGEKALLRGELIHLARGRGVRGECLEPTIKNRHATFLNKRGFYYIIYMFDVLLKFIHTLWERNKINI